MNNPVTLFVIPILLGQVQSARIPINVGEDGREGLQDLSPRLKRMDEATRNMLIAGEKIEELSIGHSTRFHQLNELRESQPSRKTKRCPRYYLTGNPKIQNTIVGDTLRKNIQKLCDQCMQSTICRGLHQCEHCAKYCEPHGVESKRNIEYTSSEDVGIAREPENDFMDHQEKRDMTLVSRSAVGNDMSNGQGREGNLEGSNRLQMTHTEIDDKDMEKAVAVDQWESQVEEEDIDSQNLKPGGYFAVSVIKPGLLMNIMLKLINLKQTSEMEKMVIMVKSRKGAITKTDIKDRVDIEFLKMLGKELDTAEKIHGKSPLNAEDINKILEIAYEKAELKARSSTQMISETEKIDPSKENINEKIVSSTNVMATNNHLSRQNIFNESPSAILHETLEENENRPMTDTPNEDDAGLSPFLTKNNPSIIPEAMSYVSSSNPEVSEAKNTKLKQDNSRMPAVQEIVEAKLEKNQEDANNSESEESEEENDKARTLHRLKYKKKRKKGHYHSYDSYGGYQHQPYSYRSANEEKAPIQMDNQENNEALTGAQQDILTQLNEDPINAKGTLKELLQPQKTTDDLTGSPQENLKSLDEHDVQKDLPRTPILKNDDLIGAQQESARPVNEDLIGYKDQFHQNEKGLIYKGQGDWPTEQPETQKARQDLDSIDSHRESQKPLAGDYHRDQSYKEPAEPPKNEVPSYRSNDEISQIDHKDDIDKLKPNKFTILGPETEAHDLWPNTLHTKPKTIVAMTEPKDLQDSNNMNIEPRVKAENSESLNEKFNVETDKMRLANSKETQTPIVGAKFQPEDLINLQMKKDSTMKESMDNMNEERINIQPQDLMILQKKKESDLLRGNINSERFSDLIINNRATQIPDNLEGEFTLKRSPSNEIVITEDHDDFDNSINKPQFTGVKNLPGQTVIQVDDQLIDVPDEEASIFQVNSQHVAISHNEKDQEQENLMINQPEIAMGENVGNINVIPEETPQISDQDKQNLGSPMKTKDTLTNKSPLIPSLSFKKEVEFRSPKISNGNERSSEIEKQENEFPTRNINPLKKNSFAPAFADSGSPKIIETEVQEERSAATKELEESSKIPEQNPVEIVGNSRNEFENAIEKKIEKLITPREQEFLHNFGKIVPSIEKMHLNSKSDIYFMGNGIKLPLKMSPNEDGTISLSVDLEKLCKCRNSTCSHKMDMMNKIDENLMEMSNNLSNPEISETRKQKVDNDIPLIENSTEKKIRKPRNHMDLSKMYKNYRKKYHRVHKRSVSQDYFRRFKEIEKGLEMKLDQLNENVKQSNREYDNMLRKGTKDLLQIKDEDQVVKQRIELVNDLIQWMKNMASGMTIVEESSKQI